MTNREMEIKNQKILSLAVCMIVSYLPLLSSINDFCNLLMGEGFIYDTVICSFVLWFLMARALLIIFKNIKADVILFTLLLFAVWKITYSVSLTNRVFMIAYESNFLSDPFYVLFVCAFSGYVFSRYLYDYKIFENMFSKFAVIVIITSTISYFITLGNDFEKQYMAFSYNMLIHIVFLIIYSIEYKKKAYLTLGILGFFLLFFAGCRGSVLCTIASVIVYFFFKKSDLTKKIAFISVMSIFAILLFVNFKSILSLLSNIATKLNIDSRTINLIVNGEFLNNSGRDAIQRAMIDEFNLFGHGIFGDRFIGKGSYAHNFIIEIITQFGYIFGGTILIGFFFLLFKGIGTKNIRLRNLVIIFLSAGFFKLLLSGSYLNQEPCFYVLLGLCVNAFKERTDTDNTQSAMP